MIKAERNGVIALRKTNLRKPNGFAFGAFLQAIHEKRRRVRGHFLILATAIEPLCFPPWSFQFTIFAQANVGFGSLQNCHFFQRRSDRFPVPKLGAQLGIVCTLVK